MPCVRCGTEFEPRRTGGKPQRYCSAPCRKRDAVEALKRRDPDYYRRWYRDNTERWAGYAEAVDPSVVQRKNRKWRIANPEKAKAAQKKWQVAHPERIRQLSRERGARQRNAVVEIFDEAEVFERDGWVCQWCHEPVDPTLRDRHPMMKSLDHIIPLVKGGEHSRANTQLVHLRCNSAKKDR